VPTTSVDEFDLDIRLTPYDGQRSVEPVTIPPRTSRTWSDPCCTDFCCYD
jgi:hypothetical protein